MPIDIGDFKLIGRDVWLCKVTVSVPENIGRKGVAQVCRLNLRFSATLEATAAELHQKAYSEAARVLSAALGLLEILSPQAVMDEIYKQEAQYGTPAWAEPSSSDDPDDSAYELSVILP
jgi:hypothetical protein